MNEERFDDLTNSRRRILEKLLFTESNTYIGIEMAFLDLYRQYQKDGENMGFFISPKFKNLKKGRISVTFKTCTYVAAVGPALVAKLITRTIPYLLRFSEMSELDRLSGFLESTYLHELGETIYTDSTSAVKQEQKKITFSSVTASDVFGDLLASTFSPFTPEDQLKLFGQKKAKPFMSKCSTLKEYAFIGEQIYTLNDYENRKKEGYKYGPELKEFYKNVLELQVGFDQGQRNEFQLVMYDVVQRHVKSKLMNCNELNEDTLSTIYDLESIIADLKDVTIRNK